MQVGQKLSVEGAYAAAELKRLLTLVNHQSDVLVVGGHVGALAIPLAKACRSLAVIEPNPDTYRLLELNVAINKCGNVQTLKLAASDQREELSFLASRANSGGFEAVAPAQGLPLLLRSPGCYLGTGGPAG